MSIPTKDALGTELLETLYDTAGVKRRIPTREELGWDVVAMRPLHVVVESKQRLQSSRTVRALSLAEQRWRKVRDLAREWEGCECMGGCTKCIHRIDDLLDLAQEAIAEFDGPDKP